MNNQNKIKIAEFTTPQNVYFVMDYFPANCTSLEYLKGIAFTDDSATVKVYDNNNDEPIKWLDSCNSLLYILNEKEFNIYIEHYKNEGFEDEKLEDYYYIVKDFTGVIYLAIENEDEVIVDSIEDREDGGYNVDNPTKLTKEIIDKATFDKNDYSVNNKDICELCEILPCSFELIIESN